MRAPAAAVPAAPAPAPESLFRVLAADTVEALAAGPSAFVRRAALGCCHVGRPLAPMDISITVRGVGSALPLPEPAPPSAAGSVTCCRGANTDGDTTAEKRVPVAPDEEVTVARVAVASTDTDRGTATDRRAAYGKEKFSF